MLEVKSLDEFILRYQVDGVMWKADRLLAHLENPVLRNDRVKEIATTLSLIPESEMVLRDDYVKKIAKAHNLVPKTLEKFILDALAVNRKKESSKKQKVKKNVIYKLEGDRNAFRFFTEFTKDKDGEPFLDKIKIDKFKFVQLLASFGFTRYESNAANEGKSGSASEYHFVRLQGNVISTVTRDQIIDHIENFIKHEYDFEKAKYKFVDAETLINAFYDQIRTIFSKDLFARVRTDSPIIINTDNKEATFLYFKNGFVEITKDGWRLRPYEEMNGSVWEHQMLDRKFTFREPEIEWNQNEDDTTDLKKMNAGYFADFCWRISNEDVGRFKSLCCIIGYLIHDYYQYKLKAVLFTDSSLSEASEGRTGKTLLGKLIGQVRSYCEINGKDFNAGDKNKYEDVKLGTQVVHLNDVKNRGYNKFEFEDTFNDITEGFMVNAKYMTPFRHQAKFIISTNKTLNIEGGSQRDRIIEFEFSPFFGEHRSPAEYYRHWFIRDWDEEEFNRFDNFICLCGQMFHIFGLIEPAAINLGERKLLNHTAKEFLEFMDEITKNLLASGQPWPGYQAPDHFSFGDRPGLQDFPFDKKAMFTQFMNEYKADFEWLKPRKFHSWLLKFSEQRLGVKEPKEWKSNGISYIQFIPDNKKIR